MGVFHTYIYISFFLETIDWFRQPSHLLILILLLCNNYCIIITAFLSSSVHLPLLTFTAVELVNEMEHISGAYFVQLFGSSFQLTSAAHVFGQD